MIELVNRQRKIPISAENWRETAENALAAIPEAAGKDATVAFVSDARMRELNRQFRGKNSTTDVLSFPHESFPEFGEPENNLGDIVISVEQAARQAAANNLTLEREISQLILHGVLHLCGYDHEQDTGEMNSLELKLRDKIGIN